MVYLKNDSEILSRFNALEAQPISVAKEKIFLAALLLQGV
jgi:hypothetical protein